MNARYLRVKKWKDWQHYKDREPPWVKLHSKLLHDDRFMELSEPEQWQLVRIWMVASQSSRFTFDEKGLRVPVVVDDEQSLRRSTKSLKKVPLEKFIAEGWLIPVAEEDLEAPLSDSTVKAPDKHDELDPGYPGDSALLEVEGRGLENFSAKGSSLPRAGRSKELPSENEPLLAKLLAVCESSSDDGTAGVFRAYATRLPQSSLAKVIETTEKQKPAVRAKYANGALKSELAEHSESREAA